MLEINSAIAEGAHAFMVQEAYALVSRWPHSELSLCFSTINCDNQPVFYYSDERATIDCSCHIDSSCCLPQVTTSEVARTV